MTEYTAVLKNGHCFRVECEHSLPVALVQAYEAGNPGIEHESFAVAVEEVAAIYPAENGHENEIDLRLKDHRPDTAT